MESSPSCSLATKTQSRVKAALHAVAKSPKCHEYDGFLHQVTSSTQVVPYCVYCQVTRFAVAKTRHASKQNHGRSWFMSSFQLLLQPAPL